MSWPLIDILKLHHPEDTEKSSVRAFGGLELNKEFNELCSDFVEKQQISYKRLAKDFFNVNHNSVQSWRGFNKKYPNGHPIPLWALGKILELLNLRYEEKHREIIEKIHYLQCGRVSEKIKAVKHLTPDLIKLCGAHAADGSLYGAKKRGVLSAVWDIGDQEKENIVETGKWIEKIFGFKPVLKKKGNMAYMRSNKQVLSRYLTQIFDFPIGRKTEIVKMPKILYGNDERILDSDGNALLKLQLGFAKEVINFDGHSTLSGRVVQVGLGSNSKELLKNVSSIFDHFGVKFNHYENKILTTSYKEGRKLYSLGIFRGQKRKKFVNLILQHTPKAEKHP
ncbi:MAG: LAGLIDADG family homing endonuclease [Candidatus Aenigmarchaeota archaeon]|nr:LAGLIDADG family homing endonuclease [Candidatus Aenigmarchaeota archaeon]